MIDPIDGRNSRPLPSLEPEPSDDPSRLGDHAALDHGVIALVWDPHFHDDLILGKLKYVATASSRAEKLSHSLTESSAYRAERRQLGWDRPTPFGGSAAVFHSAEVGGWYRRRPVAESTVLPAPLVAALENTGIPSENVWITGSRALGVDRPDSDLDLVVEAAPDAARALRRALIDLRARGETAVPESSGTWKLLDRWFPGGIASILASGRFFETFRAGDVTVAVIFGRPSSDEVVDWMGLVRAGRADIEGDIVEDDGIVFKPALFKVESGTGPVEVLSYSKVANVLRRGDRISASGWLCRCDAGVRLVQIDPGADLLRLNGQPS